MSAAYLKTSAEEDLQDADLIESEASIYSKQAKALMDMAWDCVAVGTQIREGRAGCLQGQVEDYVQKLDDLIEKKNAAFAKNREALLQKIYGGNPELQNLLESVNNHF